MKQIFIIFMLLLAFTQTATARAVKLGRNIYATSSNYTVISTQTGGGAEVSPPPEFIGCDANCQTCNSSTGLCSACSKNRYVSDNLCLLCPEMNYCDGVTAIANCDGVLCLATATPEASNTGCCCTPNCSGVTCKSGSSPVVNTTGCCCV